VGIIYLTGWVVLSKKKSTAASARFTAVNALTTPRIVWWNCHYTVGRRHWQQNFTAQTEDANLISDYNLARTARGQWNSGTELYGQM